jgi:hypothetical protein
MPSYRDESMPEETTAGSSSEDVGTVIEIDEDEDVHMEVQLAAGHKLVRVSSKILIVASPIFKKMLSSKFREGINQLQSSEMPPAPLPEDHGEAIIVICRAVHYRTEEIPEILPMDTLVDAAVFCDKYDMSRALRTWSSHLAEERLRVCVSGRS